jgi:hypothetical protein
MTQTNAIIVRIRTEQAEEFERLFEAEELPIWQDFHGSGRMLSATLARVEYGSEQQEGVQDYIVIAELPGMREHEAHDSDQRFNEFLKKARQLQPESPLVWGGSPLFQVGGAAAE